MKDLSNKLVKKLFIEKVLNNDYNKETQDFVAGIIMKNLTDGEVDVLLSLIVDDRKPDIFFNKQFVLVSGLSSWKITELGEQDLLLDKQFYYRGGLYLGQIIGDGSYSEDYNQYSCKKDVKVFGVNENNDTIAIKESVKHTDLYKIEYNKVPNRVELDAIKV
tara:strand:- start:967 stop:1452 length:486 start_codon:yes stop_codon:yes gene_type:complete